MDPSIIDEDVFGQLLQMDEEDDQSFSKSLILDYFEQAQTTFTSIKEALDKGDLDAASKLGHFLKGSSSAIGLVKVKNSCEKIQYVGNLRQPDGTGSTTPEEALAALNQLLVQAQAEFVEASEYLKALYGGTLE